MAKPKRVTFDPDGFLAELNAAMSGNYSDMDRYREFRSVLLGSDAGKRVLRQILTWAHMWQTSFDANPSLMAFNEGERMIGIRILSAIHTEPVEKPTKQNVKREPNA